MNRIILVFGLSLLSPTILAQIDGNEFIESETVFIFVRHAEKMDDGTDNPSLNIEGKERAVHLANLLLNNYDISAIYSTPYKRTKETVKPLSDSLDVAILEYGLKDPENFIQQLKENHRGAHILIAGHSNTTPYLVNILLGAQRYPKLDEDDYEKLFIIKIFADSTISEQLLSY